MDNTRSPLNPRLELVLYVALSALAGCAPSVLTIDEIPQGKRLDELDEEQREGFCDWGRGLWDRNFSVGLVCEDTTIRFTGGICDPMFPEKCKSTVREVRACTEAFIQHAVSDPCSLVDLDAERARMFWEGIPECEGVDRCN
ncbi:MAG TPA: hypothetical protein VJV78_44600 [Polyangiales bacterium]|nr:hypothetical protein [Polyangiales bacterium]